MSPVNPTVALATFFSNQTVRSWESSWIFVVIPWYGGVIAVVLYYGVYLNAFHEMAVGQKEEDEAKEAIRSSIKKKFVPIVKKRKVSVLETEEDDEEVVD